MLFHHSDETGTYIPTDAYERAADTTIHAPRFMRWHTWLTVAAFVTVAVIVFGAIR